MFINSCKHFNVYVKQWCGQSSSGSWHSSKCTKILYYLNLLQQKRIEEAFLIADRILYITYVFCINKIIASKFHFFSELFIAYLLSLISLLSTFETSDKPVHLQLRFYFTLVYTSSFTQLYRLSQDLFTFTNKKLETLWTQATCEVLTNKM